MLSLLLAFASFSISGAGPPVAEAAADAPRVEAIVIHAEGVEIGVLRDALALRLPQRRVEPYDQANNPGEGELTGVLQVRPVQGQLTVTLILSDGRAYFRTIDAQADQAARTVASAVANLVAAIEDDSVAPDQEGVALPDPPSEDPPAESPTPTVQRPGGEEAPTPTVARKVETRREPESKEPPPAPVEREREPEARLELGVAGAPNATFGLGSAPAFRGLGGAGRLSLRLRNGVLLGVGARGLTSVSGDSRLHRVRASVGGGYSLRTGDFELPVLLSATVEPWWVGGQELDSEEFAGPIPLLGLQLDLSPGYRIAVGERGASLRIGALVSMAISAELREGAVVPFVHDEATDEDLFRLGGPELMAGVELGVWIPVGR